MVFTDSSMVLASSSRCSPTRPLRFILPIEPLWKAAREIYRAVPMFWEGV